jgi:ABC-2 type transport system permease protein
MNELWREIKKHLRIYALFVKNSVMAQMEYRFNFIGNLAMESGYLLVKLSYVVVVFRSGVTIHGLTPDEMLFFIGTFIAMTGIYAGMFMINNYGLRTKIVNGDLDLFITKPVSLMFMATLRQADVTIFSVDVIAGGVCVVIAWNRLGIPLTLRTLGGYLLFFLLSAVVAYCLFLLPQTLSFKFLNTSAIASVSDMFWDFNSMPMNIYTKWFQQLGVFVLPIFVVTNFPPLFVLGKMPTGYKVWAFLLPLVMLGLVREAWKAGVRNYSSASS